MIHLVRHPVVRHKVNMLRKINLSTKEFRENSEELTSLLLYESTKDLPLEEREIENWLGTYKFKFLAGKKMAIIPILRAGMGMVKGVLQIIPNAKVGFIGLYRDHKTLEAIEYYSKLPNKMEQRVAFLLDPMLATGNTLSAAIELVKKSGCKDIRALCFVAAPEGIKKLESKYPEVEVYVAAIDEKLNDVGYIVPGLGDAGDRMFGVK